MPDDSNPFGSLTGATSSPLSMRDAPPLDLSDPPKPAEKKPSAPKAVAPLVPKEETPPKKEPPAEGPVPQGGIPRAPELTPPPVAQSTDPLHQWGSIAMIVAGLGSLLTRSHATTALNAAAGVMKGFHQNDLEAANTAFQEWKVANENTTKMANYELQAYKAMMADKKLGLDAIRTQAEAMKDYATIEHLKVSDDPEILFAKKQKIIDDSITAGQKLDAGMTRINAQDEWIKDYTTKNGHPPSADEQNTHMNNLLPAGTSPLAQERSAQLATQKAAMAEYDKLNPNAPAGDRAIELARLAHPERLMTDEEEAPLIELFGKNEYPISAATLRTPQGIKLLSDAAKKYPDIDPRDYPVGIAVKKWAEAGKGQNRLRRIFSKVEIDYCLSTPEKSAERFAVRFATKEAFFKALCQRYPEKNFPLLTVAKNCEIVKAGSAPMLSVNWNALKVPKLKTLISLTHTGQTASAAVILQEL